MAVSGQRVGAILVMGGLVVQYSYQGATYRSELGMVNMVCVASVARYGSESCDSPADRRLNNRAVGYISKLTLGQWSPRRRSPGSPLGSRGHGRLPGVSGSA